MADAIRIENLPDSGSSQRVAFDLWSRLRTTGTTSTDNATRIQAALDLYAQCLRATQGFPHDASKLT